jgi:cob(I)alamin adenosyltransferase
LLVSAETAGLDYTFQVEAGTEFLDRELAILVKKVKPIKDFVIPGSSELEALIHCARARCRTAECICSGIKDCLPAIGFLNHLSKYLFYLSLVA